MYDNQEKVIRYYENIESRLGYTFMTWNTKHFGYYPSKKRDISEKKAQENTMDLVAKELDLKNTDLILDAGCGRGTTASYLTQKYDCRIIGIDIIDFEINIAKNLIEKKNLDDKVDIKKMDYTNTSFPNNYFDKIFTIETLVHSFDIRETLKEFNRILKPSGKLTICEYSRSHDEIFTNRQKEILDLVIEGSAMDSFKFMYHETLPEFVEKAGFEILSDKDTTKNMLPSMERFHKFAKIPYMLIKLLNLQKYFINATAAAELYTMKKSSLIKYRIITAQKL